MPAQQFLCSRQAKTGAIRPACDQRVKHRVLQLERDTRSVVFDFDGGNYRVRGFVYREIQIGPRPYREHPAIVQRSHRVTDEVKKGLHNLVAVQVHVREPGVVLAKDPNVFAKLRFHEP